VRSEPLFAEVCAEPLSSEEQDRARLFCSVCLERFPEPHRTPTLLNCGHTLCRHCVSRLHQRGRKCPLCKVDLLFPERPCLALRAVFRFLNALPIRQGAQDHACCTEDLREVHTAVLSHRKEMAVVLAIPLHRAIQQDDRQAVDLSLAAGADCNVLVAGFTALHMAVAHRRFDLVPRLMATGADPTLPSYGSAETPLLLASGADLGHVRTDSGRVRAIEAMLSGVEAEAANRCVRLASSAGATPLHRIAQRLSDVRSGLFSGDSFEHELSLARLFLGFGADAEAKDIFGQSPRDLVKRSSCAEVQKLFARDAPAPHETAEEVGALKAA